MPYWAPPLAFPAPLMDSLTLLVEKAILLKRPGSISGFPALPIPWVSVSPGFTSGMCHVFFFARPYWSVSGVWTLSALP